MARPFFLFGLFLTLSFANANGAPAASPPPGTPSPARPAAALIDSLQPADLQQVIPLLKSNYINPAALSEIELDRATLAGLMNRLGHGIMLLPDRAAAAVESSSPSYSEIFAGHIGYLRIGTMTPGNLEAMDSALKKFAGQKTDALVLDLRASMRTNDFATAADFAKRFCPKGKILFMLRKPVAKQERTFTSDRDPIYQGMMMVLTDGDTAGPGEVLAGVLRLYNKAMIIGQPTAGRAVEYADLPLASGKILRVAVGEALLPQTKPLYPDGVKPDLAVEMPAADKRQIFQRSLTKGMAQFVFENERPHFNEAALLAGKNPDIDAAANRRRGPASNNGPMHDAVVQRAVDLITSLAVYQSR